MGITFDIIKILTSSFHWWLTFSMLIPGIPNMNIFKVIFMVSINSINSLNDQFWQFMAFKDTINMILNIIMLGIPGISMKNVSHQ